MSRFSVLILALALVIPEAGSAQPRKDNTEGDLKLLQSILQTGLELAHTAKAKEENMPALLMHDFLVTDLNRDGFLDFAVVVTPKDSPVYSELTVLQVYSGGPRNTFRLSYETAPNSLNLALINFLDLDEKGNLEISTGDGGSGSGHFVDYILSYRDDWYLIGLKVNIYGRSPSLPEGYSDTKVFNFDSGLLRHELTGAYENGKDFKCSKSQILKQSILKAGGLKIRTLEEDPANILSQTTLCAP